MCGGGEIEGVEGLGDEPRGEEEQTAPDGGAETPGSTGGQQEHNDDEPEGEEVQGYGKEEVMRGAAPVVERILLGFDRGLDDPEEKERGEAHGDEQGS